MWMGDGEIETRREANFSSLSSCEHALVQTEQRNAHYAADEGAPVIGDEPRNGKDRMANEELRDAEIKRGGKKMEKPNLSVEDWAMVRLDR